MTINDNTIIEDIWATFFNRVKDQVTTVDITSGTITVQNYVSSFPDQLIDSKSDYPIIVVNDPDVQTERLTNSKSKTNCSIEVEIYTTQAESASKFLSKIINSIETYTGTLSGLGIRELDVIDTTQDSAKRDAIKLHRRSVTFSFTYFQARTGGF